MIIERPPNRKCHCTSFSSNQSGIRVTKGHRIDGAPPLTQVTAVLGVACYSLGNIALRSGRRRRCVRLAARRRSAAAAHLAAAIVFRKSPLGFKTGFALVTWYPVLTLSLLHTKTSAAAGELIKKLCAVIICFNYFWRLSGKDFYPDYNNVYWSLVICS
jgi:energy-converting hydrogenase Eha subunit C